MNQTLAVAAAGLAMLAMGCAEENLVLPGDGTPNRIVAVSGDNQSAKVGSLLPSPLVVAVHDADGNGVPGVRVRWSAEGGGSVSSPEGTTDGAGRATVQRRLGDEPGVQRTIATLDLDEAVRETFTASAVPKGNPHLVIVTEPPEAGTSGEVLDHAPVVRLRSDDGVDLHEADVSVTVTIASGGGELGGTRTRATDDEGRADFPGLVIRGEGGPRKLIFAAAGIASVTSRNIDVRAPAAPPPPPKPGSIRMERGDKQSAEPGKAVSTDPAVKVLDASGAPKSGVVVVFTVKSGGGSVSGASAKSNGDGIATVSEWRLGSDPGTNTLEATASGYDGSPVTFTATAMAPPAPPPPPPPPPAPSATRLSFTDQPRNAEEDETMRTVRVAIVDQSGAVVSSARHEVKLALVVLKGGGELRGGIDRRAVDGVATFDDLEVTRKGEYRLRATADGLESAESDQFKVEDD